MAIKRNIQPSVALKILKDELEITRGVTETQWNAVFSLERSIELGTERIKALEAEIKTAYHEGYEAGRKAQDRPIFS